VNIGGMGTRLRYLYRAYRYRHRVDRAELRFVCENLERGQVAVDIGCHKGAYTYWMRRRVGPSGAVYAFEPQPKQVEYLRQAFSAMRYDNVVLVPMAVSDHCGQMELHVPDGQGMTHRATLEGEVGPPSRGGHPSAARLAAPTGLLVDVTTLDEFFLSEQRRGPDLLKIDVEGHELAVLEGAKRILKTHGPAILVECEGRHRPDGNVRPVFELLESLGYRGSFFCNGQRRPLTEFDPLRSIIKLRPRSRVHHRRHSPDVTT
jgi:FkbM family methyltransferase